MGILLYVPGVWGRDYLPVFRIPYAAGDRKILSKTPSSGEEKCSAALRKDKTTTPKEIPPPDVE